MQTNSGERKKKSKVLKVITETLFIQVAHGNWGFYRAHS